jgi:hypothetical protein
MARVGEEVRDNPNPDLVHQASEEGYDWVSLSIHASDTS